jgi:hypothetical protein
MFNIFEISQFSMCQKIRLNGLVYGVQRHYQQYFGYIVAVSFIGGGKQRKPRL